VSCNAHLRSAFALRCINDENKALTQLVEYAAVSVRRYGVSARRKENTIFERRASHMSDQNTHTDKKRVQQFPSRNLKSLLFYYFSFLLHVTRSPNTNSNE
jgi:hypothetical protein